MGIAQPSRRPMKQKARSLEVGLLLLLLTALVPKAVEAAGCQELTGVVLPNTTVTLAESIAPGAFRPPASGRGRYWWRSSCALFRVAGVLSCRGDSQTHCQIGNHDRNLATGGRLERKVSEAVGGQGWAGTIGYAGQLRAALRRGYASALPIRDIGGYSSFALDPDQLVDFAYRSTHEMTIAAKAIQTHSTGAVRGTCTSTGVRPAAGWH